MEFLARARRLLAPPEFADDEKTRVASTIHQIGLALVPMAAATEVAIWLAVPKPLTRLLAVSGFIGLTLLSMALARSGRVRASAGLFVAGTWLTIAIGLERTDALAYGALTPVLPAFALSIAAAGLLLRARSAYVVAILSSLLAPIYALVNPVVAAPPASSPLGPVGFWAVQAAIFLSIAALVSLASRQTERSRARALASEARFRAIADNAPDMIAEIDDQGRFVYANWATLGSVRQDSIDGLSRERIGMGVHPEDRPRVLEQFRRQLIEGGSTRTAFRSRDAAGNPLWLEATGATFTDADGRTRIVSVVRDMTRQRETESALRDSLERYRVLAEYAPDMIFELDDSSRVVYANPRALAALGVDLGSYSSIETRDQVHPDDFAATTRAFRALVRHGTPQRLVHRMRRGDGTYFWVATSSARYMSASGELRVIAQVRDLTDEVSLQEQLRQAQKMDAIGRLAGGVAHDFNNLLTVIGGYAGVLETSLAPGEARSAAHEICDATERAAALTRQLLVLSRRQIAQPEVVDLNASIRALEPILRRTLTERILLELTLAPDLPAIEIDPAQLDQVLLNLTLNARDAMREDGTLRIETRPGRGRRFVHLLVSDTGQGMDDATRARAFEPFFTTKPKGAGTGLGLSTTYGIVSQSGGSIAIASAPGSGTRVEISFPVSSSRPGTSSAPAASGGESSAGEATILLVEDDASVRRLLAIMLESAGYRVTSAPDAARALEIVDASPRSFDLLISDYVMPGRSGLELCTELRKRWPDLGIVMMSGHAEIPESAAAGLPRGAELLTKPFTREQLYRVVARLALPV